METMSESQVLDFAETIPGFYSRAELARLLQFVVDLPPTSTIVELGVQYGRSASIYFHDQRRRIGGAQPAMSSPTIHLVDCWVENEGDAWPFFQRLITGGMPDGYYPHFYPHWKTSEDALREIQSPISLLHIDGGHTPEVAEFDVSAYTPMVEIGGVVVVHDVIRTDEHGNDMFPGVRDAVERHLTRGKGWADLGPIDSQAAFRRLW